MILGIEIIDDKSNPACQQKDNNGNDFCSCREVHLKDLKHGFDTENNADNVNDSSNHDIINKEFVFPQGKLKHASRCKGCKGANDGDNGKG